MRVRVLAEVCVGHAMCLLACPEIFHISDEDGHAYILAPDVPPQFEAAVANAVNGCPEGAIKTY